MKSLKKSVLVIEDEKNVGKLISRILGREGYRVDVVTTGEEAVECIKNESFQTDAIVCDLHLPTLSGYALFKEIKKYRPLVKILLISGVLDDPKMEDLYARGEVMFLQKPYDNRSFLQSVRACL